MTADNLPVLAQEIKERCGSVGQIDFDKISDLDEGQGQCVEDVISAWLSEELGIGAAAFLQNDAMKDALELLLVDRAVAFDHQLVITVTGKQYEWRYRYDADKGVAGCTATGDLVLPVDVIVRLNITSDDLIHEWSVPALGLSTDGIPGRISVLDVKATKPGTYKGFTSATSGQDYHQMAYGVRVVSADIYELWRSAAIDGQACPPVP